MNKHRLLAFYFPQYHPIPENDRWWGKGFTEWFNVVKARPRYRGHYQPKLPADLGFYDLRIPEVRLEQAELAEKYGIYGFVYYHYWFNGKRVMNKPLDDVLRSNSPNFPFCLAWANEGWTVRWGPTYGSKSKTAGTVLINQKYSKEDDKNHIKWLASVFKDKRYIRIDNKPVFIVFRPSLLPNPLKTTQIWRSEAKKLGIGEIYLSMVQPFPEDRLNPYEMGFDSAIDFVPDFSLRSTIISETKGLKMIRKLLNYGLRSYSEILIPYERAIRYSTSSKKPIYKLFPCVMPGWDNSSRRSKGSTIYVNSTPNLYKKWLIAIMKRFKPYSKSENFIFINSWNEWCEGSYLEPDNKWGKDFLRATLDAVRVKKTYLK